VPVDSSGYDPADKKLKLDSLPEKKKPQDKDPERIDGGPQEVPVHFDRHFEHHSNTPVSDEDRAELKDKKADYIKPETEHVLDEKERGKKSRK
jgi:hypothetical protein